MVCFKTYYFKKIFIRKLIQFFINQNKQIYIFFTVHYLDFLIGIDGLIYFVNLLRSYPQLHIPLFRHPGNGGFPQ